MRGWTFLLGGLIVWAVHFFTLYVIGSVFLTTPLSRALALLVSLGCLLTEGLILSHILRRAMSNPTEIWMRTVALGGVGLSAVAIIWQALPALIV